jgi:hypothetical protein
VAWTRYDGGGARGELSIEGNPTVYRKTLAAYPGERGWTSMISFAQVVKGCVLFWNPVMEDWYKNCTRSF